MLAEILANEDVNASVAGVVYIVDARDVTMEKMLRYDQCLLKKTWMFVEHCLPLRLVEMHLINMRKEGREFFEFLSSFLPAKLPIKVRSNNGYE